MRSNCVSTYEYFNLMIQSLKENQHFPDITMVVGIITDNRTGQTTVHKIGE